MFLSRSVLLNSFKLSSQPLFFKNICQDSLTTRDTSGTAKLVLKKYTFQRILHTDLFSRFNISKSRSALL